MTSQPAALILRAPGTNCETETAWAFQQAGARTEDIHVNRVLENPAILNRFQILCFPGGFSFGDDISAGQILATRIRSGLMDQLQKFRDAGKLVLGICNGFQVLAKTGLLDNEDSAGSLASLTWNTNGRYTAKWVNLRPVAGPCVFLRDVGEICLPVAHGEGRFVTRDDATLQQLDSRQQLPLRYVEGPTGGNPNGSAADVAGMCDPTGRVFGLMPHPERNVHLTHHPRWTRLGRDRTPDGMHIFRNAVTWF